MNKDRDTEKLTAECTAAGNDEAMQALIQEAEQAWSQEEIDHVCAGPKRAIKLLLTRHVKIS